MTSFPSASRTLAVRAEGLVKTFGDNRAVDGVDLQVEAGTVYGVLGPNGAGKTTTIRMLATLLRPDGGRAEIFGHDVVREPQIIRQLVGVTGQYASVDETLSATENLVIFSRLLGLSRADSKRKAVELLEEFGLTDAAKRPLKHFSGGMRRRLDLAASLIAQPPLIFLDEPTTGLDPRTRAQMWDTIRRLVSGGSTVLLTTQYLDEADQLADRIAVIDTGKVVAEGTSDELKSSIGTSSLHLRPVDPADLEAVGRAVERVLGVPATVTPEAGRLTAPMQNPDLVTELLVDAARGGHPSRRAQRAEADPRRGLPHPHRPRRRRRRRRARARREPGMTTLVYSPDRPLRNHVSIRQTISNTLTMAGRGLLKVRRTPEQLIDVTVQPIVFTVMFAYIFGGAIAGSVEDYLPYLLPGILVQTVITTSVVTGVQLREDMEKGVFDRFRSLPIARVAPLAGRCSPTPCGT